MKFNVEKLPQAEVEIKALELSQQELLRNDYSKIETQRYLSESVLHEQIRYLEFQSLCINHLAVSAELLLNFLFQLLLVVIFLR